MFKSKSLLLAASALVFSVGCSHFCEKSTSRTVDEVKRDAVKLREDPKLGFAPLPIKFGETVGLVVHFNQGETLKHLDDLKNLGVKWVRDEEGWGRVEKKKGEYVWPEKLKKRLKFYKENGISVIFPLTYGANKNVYPGDPYNLKGYGGYALAAAKLLKKSGIKFVLEIFNEPHNFGILKKYGGKWHGSADCAWSKHYIKMANEALKQVKAYDPNIKLMPTTDAWSCHYWWIKGGLDKRMDAFAIHPYAHHKGSPGPDVCHFGQGGEGGWMEPWIIIDEDRSQRSLMRRLRAEYTEKLGHPVEMYITEWGYALGKFKGKRKITEDLAAAFLPRMYIIGVAAGARVVCWHVSQEMGDGPYGLIRNNQTRRKTYYAFKTMTEQLGDYRLLKQIVGMDNTTKGIQAYLFKGDAGYKLVVWNIEGPVKAAFDSASTAPLRTYDNLGKSLPIRFAKDGPPILKLDRAPIYIEGISSECSLELYKQKVKK